MNCQLCGSKFDYSLATITDKRDAKQYKACELCAADWAMTIQDRVAWFFLGWRLDVGSYKRWLTPDEFDTSLSPGDQPGESRRLPDLDTLVGRAEWCELIEAEVVRRELYTETRRYPKSMGYVKSTIQRAGSNVVIFQRPTKLAALTAAILALLEAKR